MRIENDHFLMTTPIAHRGYHDAAHGIPENSYAAFSRAIEFGYAIETDVQLTKDNKLVVFHDDNLKRMTGDPRNVCELGYDEIQSLSLSETDQKIPLFSEFLTFIGGRAPLLIEVKDQGKRKGIVKQTVGELKDYRHDYALQSFSPFYVDEFKKFAPEIMRGQLATNSQDLNFLKRIVIKTMPFIPWTTPDFISYDCRCLPYRRAKRKNMRLLSWTIRTEEEYKKIKDYADNIIFENIRP